MLCTPSASLLELSVASGCSDAALLTDLVLFCCFVMSERLEAVWVSDEEHCLNGLQGGPTRKIRSHRDTHTHRGYRCLILEHKNSSHGSPLLLLVIVATLSFISLSLSPCLISSPARFRLCANSFTVKMEGSPALHSFIWSDIQLATASLRVHALLHTSDEIKNV